MLGTGFTGRTVFPGQAVIETHIVYKRKTQHFASKNSGNFFFTYFLAFFLNWTETLVLIYSVLGSASRSELLSVTDFKRNTSVSTTNDVSTDNFSLVKPGRLSKYNVWAYTVNIAELN